MVATGEKRSLDFSLVCVPLTESLLEETPALKTTHMHRKRTGAQQSHKQDDTDAIYCHPQLLSLIMILLANVLACNRTKVGVEG